MRLKSIGRSARVYPLAQVPLTENERHEAEHYLLLGERVAELIICAADAVVRVVRYLERNLRELAGRRSAS